MKRLTASLALAAALALIALPSAAMAQGADTYGVGGGSVDFGTGKKVFKFAFSAHTGPQGDFGSFRLTIASPFEPLDAHADVDCVNVFPNPLGFPFPNRPSAGGWISGPVKKVTPQPNDYGLEPGDQLLAGMNDFGNPSNPIRDQFAPGINGGPQVCKLFGPGFFSPISQGNIVIKPG